MVKIGSSERMIIILIVYFCLGHQVGELNHRVRVGENEAVPLAPHILLPTSCFNVYTQLLPLSNLTHNHTGYYLQGANS
jgi:hypothetical protein